MKINRLFRLSLLFFIFILLLVSSLKADTILLIDGTYLVGKIIEWDAYHIIFKNSHGVFAIRKSQLVKMYITENLYEDIDLKTKLGHNISDGDIIKHYLSGKKGVPMGGIDRNELESGMLDTELGCKFDLTGNYYFTTGVLADKLPKGLGGSFGYTQSLGRYLSDEAAFNAPSIYLETEFIIFEAELTRVISSSVNTGPKWEFNFPGGRWGKTLFRVTPGVTLLSVKNEDYRNRSMTFSLKGAAGYEYQKGRFFASAGISYIYIFDKIAPLQACGIYVSSAYKF